MYFFVINLDVSVFQHITQEQIDLFVSFIKTLEFNPNDSLIPQYQLVRENTASSFLVSQAFSEIIPLNIAIKDKDYWPKTDSSYRLTALAKNLVSLEKQGLKMFFAICERNDCLIQHLPKYLAKELGVEHKPLETSNPSQIAKITIDNCCKPAKLHAAYYHPTFI